MTWQVFVRLRRCEYWIFLPKYLFLLSNVRLQHSRRRIINFIEVCNANKCLSFYFQYSLYIQIAMIDMQIDKWIGMGKATLHIFIPSKKSKKYIYTKIHWARNLYSWNQNEWLYNYWIYNQINCMLNENWIISSKQDMIMIIWMKLLLILSIEIFCFNKWSRSNNWKNVGQSKTVHSKKEDFEKLYFPLWWMNH